MHQKKANAIIKVYNDAMFTPQEWEIVAFHVYNGGPRGVLDNMQSFYDGYIYFLHSEHFGGRIRGQQEFDFGGLK